MQHNSASIRDVASPQKYFANKKKMGSQVKISSDFTEPSPLDSSAVKRKAAQMGIFSENEAKLPPSAKKSNSKKARDMVGNCPINHDIKVSNFSLDPRRQTALACIFGSEGMADSMTGANRSQQKPG